MRIITTQVQALLDSGHFGRRTLIRFDMDSGPVGYWDDAYEFAFNGVTYLPAPGGFKLGPIEASRGLVIHRQNIVFSGIDPRIAAQLEHENYQNKPAFIHIAIVDPATNVIAGVVPWFAGKIDQAPVKEKVGGDATITAVLVSNNWELNKKGTRTRSDTDQRHIDANDGLFRYAASAVSEPIFTGQDGPRFPG